MIKYDLKALDYIAKIADGGMRDAITLMDKCLAYSTHLNLENVIKALGTVDYQTMFNLTNSILCNDANAVIVAIEKIHRSGKDLKQFIRTYMNFLLDINKFAILGNYKYLEIPSIYEINYSDEDFDKCRKLLDTVIKLNTDIKWEVSTKSVIEATLILECEK